MHLGALGQTINSIWPYYLSSTVKKTPFKLQTCMKKQTKQKRKTKTKQNKNKNIWKKNKQTKTKTTNLKHLPLI